MHIVAVVLEAVEPLVVDWLSFIGWDQVWVSLGVGPVVVGTGGEGGVWVSVLWNWSSDVWRWVFALLGVALDIIVQLNQRFGLRSVLGLHIHEIITGLPVLWDQWLLKLLMNFWVSVNSPWSWLETSRVTRIDLGCSSLVGWSS